MCALRLLIADDHEIVRCGLCALLKSHPEWEVCAEAVDGQEAVDMARQLKPDIVILDIGMPNMNGLIAARQIRQTQPNQKILVLSVTDEEQLVQEVLAVGARGFVLKSDAARDLIAAVEALQAGTTFFTSHIEEMVLRGYLNKRQDDADGVPHLSSRRSTTFIKPYLARAGDRATCSRGKVHERGRGPLKLEGKSGRDTPIDNHAQTWPSHHQRIGSLCRSKSHHPG